MWKLELYIIRTFLPHFQEYRVGSRFLSTCQGQSELSDNVKDIDTLIAAMHNEPLPVVYVMVHIEGLRPGPEKAVLFRFHCTTLDGSIDIAHNA